MVFDKTGTLTKGRPEVTDVWSGGAVEEDEILRLAAAIETRSGHPLAAAIVTAAEARRLPLPEVADFESVTGKGLSGTVAGARVLVGNDKLIEGAGLAVPNALAERHAALECECRRLLSVDAEELEAAGLLLLDSHPAGEPDDAGALLCCVLVDPCYQVRLVHPRAV